MKIVFFLSFALFGPLNLTAQHEEHRERIKSLKTAYITENLNLSPEEAQKFWPIYNAFIEERRNLYRKEDEDIGRMECISEERANELINEYVNLEKQDYLLEKQFYQDLKEIFTAKRIILLKKTENEFNHKMIREYRERHSHKKDKK
ncbi:MAG TPA: hypothetical protein VFI78_00550 [Salinimicrobium sp.]|nr:hypothetical protein [Salinimicrobium sp.]